MQGLSVIAAALVIAGAVCYSDAAEAQKQSMIAGAIHHRLGCYHGDSTALNTFLLIRRYHRTHYCDHCDFVLPQGLS